MRLPQAIALLAMSVLLVAGCTRAIPGTAMGDIAPPLVDVTQDQSGIRAGLADAPVQLEIYTEPQCSHCADLQKDFGDQFAYYIGAGQLAITYRPMTFLDSPATDGHSGRVANALFAAATPGGAPPKTTTGRQLQRYVEQLWADQQPGGPGPTDAELADLARKADVPAFQARTIEQGANVKTKDDLANVETTNFELLYQIDPVNTGTPTVFDLKAGKKLDVYDDDWLSRLMAS